MKRLGHTATNTKMDSTNALMNTIVAVTVVVMLAAIVIYAIKHMKMVIGQKRSFRSSRSGWTTYISFYDHSVIGLDPLGKSLVLGTMHAPLEYAIDQLSSIEILHDNTSIISTNRGSQLVGAAIGGLLTGGAGAVIGGLSGIKTSESRIRSLGLKVTVDDRSHPVHLILFYRSPSRSGASSSDEDLAQAVKDVDHFYAIITTSLRTLQLISASPLAGDVGDKIARLWSLKEAGALTMAEFQSQKDRLFDPTREGPSKS